MAELLNNINRQLIPRWHTSRKISLSQARVGEILVEDAEAFPTILKKEQEWKDNPSLGTATELLVGLKMANMNGRSSFSDVSSFLKKNYELLKPEVQNFLTPNIKLLDESETYETDEQRIHSIISKLKNFLREYPDDALTWNDISFYYAAIGEDAKSEKAMRVAFSLSSFHPFLARSYARLLVHHDDPEQALRVLKLTGLNKTHPEVMSAEVAIRTAFEIGKAEISTGRKLINKHIDQPYLISELAAAIGTIEIENGATKRGKENLVIASIFPTENTVAQLKWLSQQHKVLVQAGKESVKSLEALAIYHYNAKDYKSCRQDLIKLHQFQPFTHRALADAGYMSLIGLDDPEYVVQFSQYYHHFLRDNVIALNNCIVARMELGHIDGIEDMIRHVANIADHDRDKAMISATLGMYMYRTGNVEQGRKLYENSISYFKKTNSKIGTALALLYQATLEHKLGLSNAASLTNQAEKAAKSLNNFPEVLDKLKRETSTKQKQTTIKDVQ